MRKYVILLIIVLLGFVWMPFVHAEELPQEGVTYFMTYPNGDVEVTESYEEAMDPPEKLLYSLETDENGVIPLCDCGNEGVLRLVQHVPSGYTTNQSEIYIDLANESEASFIDYRGGNPATSRGLIVFVVLAIIVAATILVSRKNKKAFMIIPVLLLLGAFQVHAEGSCFKVQVKDGNGNPLANVTVDVYGVPVVEAAPAVKFDANGGFFFNGKTVLYAKLPSASCTPADFLDSLTEEEYNYLVYNFENAYRAGYYYDEMNYPSVLTNGSVVKVMWDADEEVQYLRINGNGGTYNYYGEALSDLYITTDTYPFSYFEGFKNGDLYYVGYDNNAACENYTVGGGMSHVRSLEEASMNVAGTIYLCWNAKPDGIYVNDVLFRGSQNTCYYESSMLRYEDGLSFHNTYNSEGDYTLSFIAGDEPGFVFNSISISPKERAVYEYDSMPISSVEVVYNGEVIYSLGTNDLNKVNGIYQITDTAKINSFREYVLGFNDCFHAIS